MDSDEEHFDEGSPIGQIIAHINKLCKKPQIDEQLQKAIQRFNAHVDQQKQYLVNGIFNINFAEAALFLQSCTTLYGKKVDLLWDELLVLHTRLIEYDCEHEKKKGTKVDDDVIKKLEERRNRYKRKKKFKLTLEQDQTGINLFDKPLQDVRQYDPDENITKMWKRIEHAGNEHRSVPYAVYKQQAKMYRMKNYRLLKCEDFDVLDLDDDEFNTKYSRIPSWHVINHLIEYNNQGLLPDKENCIAKLKLMMYGRLKFMDMNKIPVNTPYKEYATQYMVYRQQFFEKEAKKWQNMPLDTMADLHKQLLYLARMEKQASTKSCQSPMPKVFPGIIHCCEDSKGSLSSNCESCMDITINSDKQFLKSDLYVSLEQMSSDVVNTKLRQDSGYYDFEDVGDKEMETRQVEGQTEVQVQCEGQVEGQSQCEGQAEGQSQDKEQTEGQTQVEGQNQDKEQTEGQDTSIGQSEGQTECDSQDKEQTEGQSQDKEQAEGQDQSEGGNESQSQDKVQAEGQDQGQTSEVQSKEQLAQAEGQDEGQTLKEGLQAEGQVQVAEGSASGDKPVEKEAPSGASVVTAAAGESTTTTTASSDVPLLMDQDKENTPPPPDLLPYDAGGGGDDDIDDCRSIVSDHDYCANAPATILAELNRNRHEETIAKKMAREMPPPPLPPVFGGSRIIPKPVRLKEKRPKEPKAKENEGPVPKVRKLSQKQLEKLKKNLVIAEKVRMSKFEKFFARNYQTQMGEGEIQAMSSDSESETSDVPELPEPLPPADDLQNADTASLISDHSYCQAQQQDKLHDSGFHDDSQLLLDDSRMEEDRAEAEGEAEGAAQEGGASSGEARVEGRRKRKEAVADPMEEQIQQALKLFRESRKSEEEYVRRSAESIARHQMTEEELAESRKRVENWRSHIMPILRGLSESEFDIHEYGSAIMEGVDVGEKKPFKEVVQGKPPSEVEMPKGKTSLQPTNQQPTTSTRCLDHHGDNDGDVPSSERQTSTVVRYFISSLQLANTGNIDICGVQPGELANESFEVKLLTKERYHEHLNEFHAPSEEERKEKLKKIKEMREKDQSEEPPHKQPKPSPRGKTPLNSGRCFTKSSRKLTAAASQQQQLPSVRICIERLQPPTSLSPHPLPVFTPLPAVVQRAATPLAPLRNAPPTFEEDVATPSTSRASFEEFLQSEPVDRQLFSTPLPDRPPAKGRGGAAPKVRHRLFE